MTPFEVFQSGVCAMERIVQAESTELLGALGVAADPYPHQIANVRRILEATEIRHLIADEVGLGKTVQSFMIINVLMRRDPSLRIWEGEYDRRAQEAKVSNPQRKLSNPNDKDIPNG